MPPLPELESCCPSSGKEHKTPLPGGHDLRPN